MASEWKTRDVAAEAKYASLGAVVGAHMRTRRQERGWTLAEMSARLEAVGLPMHQATVSKLEMGKKEDLLLGWWFLIARALEVSPVDLLVPPGDTAEVAIGTEGYTGAELRAVLGQGDGGAARARAALARWDELRAEGERVAAELRELVDEQGGR